VTSKRRFLLHYSSDSSVHFYDILQDSIDGGKTADMAMPRARFEPVTRVDVIKTMNCPNCITTLIPALLILVINGLS
jgi:hypothetical protein